MIKTKNQANKAEDTLPNTLGGLIRVALKDLYRVERMTKIYIVDMKSWHYTNSHCSVCFAGVVMANTLKVDPALDMGPSNFCESIDHKLDALDDLRRGRILVAAGTIGGYGLRHRVGDAGFDNLYVVADYSSDRNQFKADMRRLATRLEKAGF